MKLYIIRHGETDWNIVRRLQGNTDIPLNENGRELARLTAKALKDTRLDLIYTSPLQRAKETALILKGDRDIPVIEDNRIREMCFGEYEGCIAKENPDIWRLFESPEKYVAPENGETLNKLLGRTKSFLDEITGDENLKDKVILISTHGAALRGLLSAIKETPLEDFWAGGVHKNCAVTIVEKNEKGKLQIIEEAKTYY